MFLDGEVRLSIFSHVISCIMAYVKAVVPELQYLGICTIARLKGGGLGSTQLIQSASG